MIKKSSKKSKVVIFNHHLCDSLYHFNLCCCLDRCDSSCPLIHECWLSPFIKDPRSAIQLTINF